MDKVCCVGVCVCDQKRNMKDNAWNRIKYLNIHTFWSRPGWRSLGFRGLGPATLSTRQVVREGPGRVPLGAERRAVSASSSLEGNILTPLRRHGLPPHPPAGARPPAVCIPQPGHLLPRAVVVPPLSQLIGSLEPCSRRREDSIGYRCSYFQTFLSVFPLVAIF